MARVVPRLSVLHYRQCGSKFEGHGSTQCPRNVIRPCYCLQVAFLSNSSYACWQCNVRILLSVDQSIGSLFILLMFGNSKKKLSEFCQQSSQSSLCVFHDMLDDFRASLVADFSNAHSAAPAHLFEHGSATVVSANLRR